MKPRSKKQARDSWKVKARFGDEEERRVFTVVLAYNASDAISQVKAVYNRMSPERKRGPPSIENARDWTAVKA